MPTLKRYGLFISHAWGYNDDYYKLVNLLDNHNLFNWYNFSVPEHEPLIDPNTIVGKTFGTNNNDFIDLFFYIMWGSTYKGLVNAANAETYVGAGYIDITQVQVSVGDTSPTYYPRSYQEELALCQRYFCTNYAWGIPLGTSGACEGNSYIGRATSTSDIDVYNWTFPVRMRIFGTPVYTTNVKVYGYNGTIDKVCAADNTTLLGGTISVSRGNDCMIARIHSTTAVFTANVWYWWVGYVQAEI